VSQIVLYFYEDDAVVAVRSNLKCVKAIVLFTLPFHAA